jgi:hypothetical protein
MAMRKRNGGKTLVELNEPGWKMIKIFQTRLIKNFPATILFAKKPHQPQSNSRVVIFGIVCFIHIGNTK